MLCKCRNCGKHYQEAKSRADYKGYCSQVCLHEKARSLGYRKPKKHKWMETPSEYQYLSKANKIGSVPVDSL